MVLIIAGWLPAWLVLIIAAVFTAGVATYWIGYPLVRMLRAIARTRAANTAPEETKGVVKATAGPTAPGTPRDRRLCAPIHHSIRRRASIRAQVHHLIVLEPAETVDRRTERGDRRAATRRTGWSTSRPDRIIDRKGPGPTRAE
jgi:hypothetical protein